MKFGKHLDALAAIAADYTAKIDSLVDNYKFDGRYDYQYNDEMRQQRVNERNARYESEIKRIADSSREQAQTHLDGLRQIMTDFVTSDTDPALLAQLQAIKATGIKLTGAEIQLYQKKCNTYLSKRILAEIVGVDSGPPKIEDFESDLSSLTETFSNLFSYLGNSGQLCGLSPTPPASRWAADTVIGHTIERSRWARPALGGEDA